MNSQALFYGQDEGVSGLVIRVSWSRKVKESRSYNRSDRAEAISVLNVSVQGA